MAHDTAMEVIEKRFSANQFDTVKTLSKEEIRELIRLATQAPSSFNIQHWRFVAVTEKAGKEKLKSVAYNQQKIADAAVTFIVLGDLNGHEKLPKAYAPMLAKGAMDQPSIDRIVGYANGMYTNPALRRDEAIRSGSMAAMNLMNAATAQGLVSGAMIGFDPEGVKREFGISDQYVPVMLIAVGQGAPGDFPKKPRFPVEDVLSFEQGREFKI